MTQDQRELVSTVKESGAALLALVDDLLDLSRVESGKLDCKRTAFNLKKTVDQAVALIAAGARQKGLALTISCPALVPDLLLGDENRVRQILVNYLHNALKFTDFGSISVHVTAETSVNAMTDVLIAVRDSGKGISKEAQSRLFTPFRQADASSTRKHGGLGLGLALSKRIAEIMGGSVGLISSLGKGSTFWVRLSLEETKKRLAEDPVPQRVAETVTLEAPRVLVAEDNAVNQKLVLRFLQKLGCVPEIAPNGALAVQLFQQNHFDAVLMDCQMPELDGYEAAERIRHIEFSRNQKRTPIIAVTAHAMTSDRKRCLDSGMDDHITKPLSLACLTAVLVKWSVLPAATALQTCGETIAVA